MGNCVYNDGSGPCGAKTIGLSQFCSRHTSLAEPEATIEQIPARRIDRGWSQDKTDVPEGHNQDD
jgi:hypothetical protein